MLKMQDILWTSSLVIRQQTEIDKHLVWQIGQGLLNILPRCPLENSIGSEFSLVIKEHLSKHQIRITVMCTTYMVCEHKLLIINLVVMSRPLSIIINC